MRKQCADIAVCGTGHGGDDCRGVGITVVLRQSKAVHGVSRLGGEWTIVWGQSELGAHHKIR